MKKLHALFGKSQPKQAERGLSYHEQPLSREESDVSASRTFDCAELIQKAPTSEIVLKLMRTPMGYGIGLSDFKLAEKTDFNRVTELASEGIAADAGVRLFDKIIKVDGEACADVPAVQLMVGKQARSRRAPPAHPLTPCETSSLAQRGNTEVVPPPPRTGDTVDPGATNNGEGPARRDPERVWERAAAQGKADVSAHAAGRE